MVATAQQRTRDASKPVVLRSWRKRPNQRDQYWRFIVGALPPSTFARRSGGPFFIEEAWKHPKAAWDLSTEAVKVIDENQPLAGNYVGGRMAMGLATRLGPGALYGDTLTWVIKEMIF
jgi:hypothetical protein